MRAQVTIDHVLLSDGKMRVTVIDNGAAGYTIDDHIVAIEDAEWQLLAQAIDRFSAVMTERARTEAARRDAELVEKALATKQR